MKGTSRLAEIACTILVTAVAGLDAQSETANRADQRALLPRDREVRLARSAAPKQVSDSATVLVLTANGYVVAERGTNGVTCYVNRSQLESLEPHCFDEEASATILPMQLRRAELRQAGKSKEEIDRDVADGLASGRFRVPRRPAMSYMMSSGQVLYNDEGRLVGKWLPHLMIYYPYLKNADLGLGTPASTKAALVGEEGAPTAHVLIVVRDFVDPAP